MPIDKTPFTDDSVMPWGEHKGTSMGNLPIEYLFKLSTYYWLKDWPGIYAYVESRKDDIQREEARQCAENPQKNTFDSFDDYLSDRGPL